MNSLVLKADFVVDSLGNIAHSPMINLPSPISNAGEVDLSGKMLLPGFVNMHSHAFQWALRGRVEYRSAVAPLDDFFSWREAMYELAKNLSPSEFEKIATGVYRELLQNGFVSVCEFHYLHHDTDGNPYADPLEMSRRLVNAAQKAGIRICLLQTAYSRGGFQKDLSQPQKRFAFSSVDAFLAHCDLAQKELQHPLLSHGVAIHSVRACPRSWIKAVAEYAQKGGLPLHIHASEQVSEVSDCVREHGMTPIELLYASGALTQNTTLIHATHITPKEIELVKASGSSVCLCPSTERNLGDGLCPISDLHQAGVPLCIGTDQHVRTDAVSELREIEEQERLRVQKRCALLKPGQRLAHALIPIGASSRAGDMIAVRIPDELRGEEPQVILDAWLIAGSGRDVTDVWVGVDRIFHRAYKRA